MLGDALAHRRVMVASRWRHRQHCPGAFAWQLCSEQWHNDAEKREVIGSEPGPIIDFHPVAAVLGIVRGHGGRIEVESVLQRGSTFSVVVPRVYAAEAAQETLEETWDVQPNRVPLLVVEDTA